MSNCQHDECHNVQNCAICSEAGATWCPHQNCRYQNFRRLAATTTQRQSAGARGIAWTPTLAANVLKAVFVAAATAGTWWLLRSSATRPAGEGDSLLPDAGPSPADFSSWEPES